MPFALAAVLKFNVNFPIHDRGALPPLGAIEVIESLFIMICATLSFYMVIDGPKIFPSFVASLPRSNLSTQWAAFRNKHIYWAVLTFAMTQAAVYAGEYRSGHNMQFAIGLLVGTIFSFKFAGYIDRTQQFVKNIRLLMLGIVCLRLIELATELLPHSLVQDVL